MRPITSPLLQQNNNNNYPCLSAVGPEPLPLKCPHPALPLSSRPELGLTGLPLIRGLRAWALCSKSRHRPGGPLAQAPVSCPRPADVHLSEEWGLSLGLDARRAGIGALVATLQSREGSSRTQTQSLFLRTAQAPTPQPGGVLRGWLRSRTGGAQAQPTHTAASRARERSGRRWRKSAHHTAGREKVHTRQHRLDQPRLRCSGEQVPREEFREELAEELSKEVPGELREVTEGPTKEVPGELRKELTEGPRDVTEELTDKLTEEITEPREELTEESREVTEEPREELTEVPREELTEVPREELKEEPREVTEELTEKVTEELTEKVTEELTEKVTEELTEPREGLTEEITEEITEPKEELTEELSEKVTEKPRGELSEECKGVTEGPREKLTEELIEEGTEKLTEEPREEIREEIAEPRGELSETPREVTEERIEKVTENLIEVLREEVRPVSRQVPSKQIREEVREDHEKKLREKRNIDFIDHELLLPMYKPGGVSLVRALIEESLIKLQTQTLPFKEPHNSAPSYAPTCSKRLQNPTRVESGAITDGFLHLGSANNTDGLVCSLWDPACALSSAPQGGSTCKSNTEEADPLTVSWNGPGILEKTASPGEHWRSPKGDRSYPGSADPEGGAFSDPAPDDPEQGALRDPAPDDTEQDALRDPAPDDPERGALRDPAPDDPYRGALGDPAPDDPYRGTLRDPAPDDPEQDALRDPAPDDPEQDALRDPAPDDPYRGTLRDPAPDDQEQDALRDPAPDDPYRGALRDPAPDDPYRGALRGPAPDDLERGALRDPAPDDPYRGALRDPAPDDLEWGALGDPAPDDPDRGALRDSSLDFDREDPSEELEFGGFVQAPSAWSPECTNHMWNYSGSGTCSGWDQSDSLWAEFPVEETEQTEDCEGQWWSLSSVDGRDPTPGTSRELGSVFTTAFPSPLDPSPGEPAVLPSPLGRSLDESVDCAVPTLTQLLRGGVALKDGCSDQRLLDLFHDLNRMIDRRVSGVSRERLQGSMGLTPPPPGAGARGTAHRRLSHGHASTHPGLL